MTKPATKPSHTPEPWSVIRVPHGRSERFTIISDTTKYVVAHVVKQGLPSDGANALLIAAAPDLLAALESIEASGILLAAGASAGDLRLLDKVQTAIRKATGQES